MYVVYLTNIPLMTKSGSVNRGVRSLLRKPTNGGVEKEKKKNCFSYDGDKNGERLPRRPPPSLAAIHQP